MRCFFSVLHILQKEKVNLYYTKRWQDLRLKKFISFKFTSPFFLVIFNSGFIWSSDPSFLRMVLQKLKNNFFMHKIQVFCHPVHIVKSFLYFIDQLSFKFRLNRGDNTKTIICYIIQDARNTNFLYLIYEGFIIGLLLTLSLTLCLCVNLLIYLYPQIMNSSQDLCVSILLKKFCS